MKVSRFIVKSLLLTLCVLGFFFVLKIPIKYEDRWNWSLIELTPLVFPPQFIWGTADSSFQTEGIETAHGKSIQNNWTAWQEEEVEKSFSLFRIERILNALGIINRPKHSRIPPEKRVGNACERWSRYKDDILLLKEAGMQAHRFSFDWSKIEPEQGIYDYDALQHYLDYTQELINHSIQPIITLFHHTMPLWFSKKGGFEHKENIDDFVRFARFVFLHCQNAGLLPKMKYWITINEPMGFAFAAYINGNLPPGKKFNFKLAGLVAKNLIDAHCAVYETFKSIDSSVKISIAHAMNPIQPYHPWNPFDVIPAHFFDYLVNDVVLEYFKTGNFYWPKTSLTEYLNEGLSHGIYSQHHNPNAVGRLDFIGVNYYSHTLLKMFQEASRPEEVLADGYQARKIKALYPEGFYHSLKKAATLGVPLLITENGFASNSNSLRTDYLQKHLYVVHKALQDGMDICGYLFWTLTDCFGWDSGQRSIHGIYSVDYATQKRTLKPSAVYLLETIKNHNQLFLSGKNSKIENK